MEESGQRQILTASSAYEASALDASKRHLRLAKKAPVQAPFRRPGPASCTLVETLSNSMRGCALLSSHAYRAMPPPGDAGRELLVGPPMPVVELGALYGSKF